MEWFSYWIQILLFLFLPNSGKDQFKGRDWYIQSDKNTKHFVDAAFQGWPTEKKSTVPYH